MIKNLYVGPVNYNWTADEKFSHMSMLTKKNFHKHLNDNNEKDFYTSVEDLDLKLEQMQKLIDLSGSIQFVGLTDEFLFQKDQFDMYNWWNFIRLVEKSRHKTNFFIDKNIFSTCDFRDSAKTLFVSGCSFTAGVGVDSHQRYGDILAKKLDMPYVLMAQSGSSIGWQADRILQSDLRKGDIVVWGLTSLDRFVSAQSHTDWIGIPIQRYVDLDKSLQYHKIEFFTSWTLRLSCIKNILQVENFCQKVGAKLYLVNLLETTLTESLFGKQKNYIDCLPEWDDQSEKSLKFLDVGSDNEHPGPLQHQLYADIIYKNIMNQELDYVESERS
jgi:hypothetical protein